MYLTVTGKGDVARHSQYTVLNVSVVSSRHAIILDVITVPK